MNRTRTFAAIAVAAAALPLAACGGGSNPLQQPSSAAAPGGSAGGSTGGGGSLTIGSANFPESTLLGEVYAQALEAKGVTVNRHFNIGNRETYLKAITGGEIDLLPEYTGSLLNYYDKTVNETDSTKIYDMLKSKLPQGLTILDKSAAEDKNSLAVTKDTAQAWSLKAIPDLKAHESELTIAAPPEFRTRAQGLVGLKNLYGITPKEFRPLDSQATVNALKNGQVKAANIFTTDPSIAANGFVVLDDPKHLFPADNVVPLVRSDKESLVKDTLNALSAKLDTGSLAEMVKEVVVDHKDDNVVAKDWLTSAGLL